MIFIFLAIALFGLDCGVKYYVDKTYPLDEVHPILNGHIMIQKFYNTGAAYGFMQKHPHTMKQLHRLAVFLLLIVFGWFFVRNHPKERMTTTGLALFAAGGLNNLFDRERKGHVVDYFWFPHKKKKKRRIIYNLSDLFIFLGAIVTTLGSRK